MYVSPNAGKKQPVPRHMDIEDALAKHIRRYLGLERSHRDAAGDQDMSHGG